MSNTWESIAALEENWDSYGASKITPESIELGKRIERLIKEGVFYIFPLATGGVELEWHVGQEELAIEISEDTKEITPFVWQDSDHYWPGE